MFASSACTFHHQSDVEISNLSVTALWQWATKILQDLPLRCIPIILTDANSHVGNIWTSDPYEFEGVGPHGAEQETWSGRQLHNSANEHTL
eukprot:10394988-Heterocapsa_arctica.AAC.1